MFLPKKTKLIFSFLTLISIPTFGTKNAQPDIKKIDAVLIEGTVSIGTHAPEGWFLDQTVANQMGVCAFYLLNNFNLQSSPAIIYPRISAMNVKGNSGIETLIQDVAKPYSKKSSKFKLEEQSSYKSAKNFEFKIRHFLNGPPPNEFEAAAYMPYKDRIFFAVFSARNKKSFYENKKSFFNFLENVSPYSTELTALSGMCLYPKN